MTSSLESLYTYKQKIVKVKNLYHTVKGSSDDSSGVSWFDQKLIEGLPNILEILKELQTNLSDVFSLYEPILNGIYSNLINQTTDDSDYILCLNILDNLLNDINYRIKTTEAKNQHTRFACIKLSFEDNYSMYYKNEDGYEFEVRTIMYDKKNGIDYIVFTDYYDREYEDRYFIAHYVCVSNDTAYLFPVSSKEKEHYIEDIKLYDEELFDEVDEILDYFDLYY